MSLSISIIKTENCAIDTDELECLVTPPHNNLFGSESCRHELWGLNVVKELGCLKLYELKNGNVLAFDDDIIELRLELERLRSNLEYIEKESKYDRDYILFRINNALEMIRVVTVCSNHNLGVALW